MATLTLDENQATYQIRGFKQGMIRINDTTYLESVIVSANTLITHWPPQHIQRLTVSDLAIVSTLEPDILLIGTGSEPVFLDAHLYASLIHQGIGVEVMNTSAACRTFNALSAENRNVVAALILS